MTDISRYKNASLSILTMELIKKQAKEICPVELSISKTIEHNCRFYEKYKHLVKPDDTLITSRFRHGMGKNSEHKLHLVRKLPDPAYVGTATTKDEIKSRNRIIFENRVVSNNLTLQQLGTMFNITRERVRQIQEHEVSNKKLNPQTQDKHANSN
jgi:hypothetical protein